MNETFCLVVEVENAVGTMYAAILFCVDPSTGVRSSLFVTSSFVIAMRLETGLSFPLRTAHIDKSLLACLACSDDPYEAIGNVFELMMQSGMDISSAEAKIESNRWQSLTSPFLSHLG